MFASGTEENTGADGLALVAAGLLAFLAGSGERGADAARAGAEAAGNGGVAVRVVVSAEAAAVDVVAVATAGMVAPVAAVLVSSADRLAATLTVDEGVVAVMLLVLVTAEGSGVAGALWGLRVNQNAPTPMATTAVPISAQGARDLLFRAEGGNCTGAASSGMDLKLPGASALRADVLPEASGSAVGNCVGENCVLAPYEESL